MRSRSLSRPVVTGSAAAASVVPARSKVAGPNDSIWSSATRSLPALCAALASWSAQLRGSRDRRSPARRSRYGRSRRRSPGRPRAGRWPTIRRDWIPADIAGAHAGCAVDVGPGSSATSPMHFQPASLPQLAWSEARRSCQDHDHEGRPGQRRRFAEHVGRAVALAGLRRHRRPGSEEPATDRSDCARRRSRRRSPCGRSGRASSVMTTRPGLAEARSAQNRDSSVTHTIVPPTSSVGVGRPGSGSPARQERTANPSAMSTMAPMTARALRMPPKPTRWPGGRGCRHRSA